MLVDRTAERKRELDMIAYMMRQSSSLDESSYDTYKAAVYDVCIGMVILSNILEGKMPRVVVTCRS